MNTTSHDKEDPDNRSFHSNEGGGQHDESVVHRKTPLNDNGDMVIFIGQEFGRHF